MKKNLFTYIVSLILIALVPACSGTESGEDSAPAGELVLQPSKDVIEADGKDEVEFAVYANGVDVTANAYVMDVLTGLDLKKNSKGRFVYTAIANGEFEFQADYNGKSVTTKVTAQNRKNYEEFYRRVAVFKVTGTWCSNCPSMTTALAKVEEKMPDRMVKMAFHYTSSLGTDPYAIDATSFFFNAPYNVVGAPTSIYNLNVVESDRSKISSIISQELRDNPATCGIKVKAYTSGTGIKVDASLKSSTGGKYDLVYVVLEDGLTGGGSYFEEVYDYTAVAVSGNFLSHADTAKEVAKGEEAQFGTFTISGADNFPKGAKTRVAVYALVVKDGKYIVDNIVSCDVDGEEVDYKYND